MMNHLTTLAQASSLIKEGRPLLIAGAKALLQQLPHGLWIGGTTPYFMDQEGCLRSEDRVFVTELPFGAASTTAGSFGVEAIDQLLVHRPESGVVFLIIPAFSEVHRRYAEEAHSFEGMYMKPVVGWVSGVPVEEIGQTPPEVFLGTTGESLADRAVALHVNLPEGSALHLDIHNVFQPGTGPEITFEQTGFRAGACTVDGRPANLASYIVSNQIDVKLPLVADFGGANINSSVAGVDAEHGEVTFYAPVFPGVVYRFAEPVADYAEEFQRTMPAEADPIFACNCILNYLYGELEGRRISSFGGPITFGEIGYVLLNQTLVYAELRNEA